MQHRPAWLPRPLCCARTIVVVVECEQVHIYVAFYADERDEAFRHLQYHVSPCLHSQSKWYVSF